MKWTVIISLFLSSGVFAQASKQDSTWKPMTYFIGNWAGKGESMSGNGNYD